MREVRLTQYTLTLTLTLTPTPTLTLTLTLGTDEVREVRLTQRLFGESGV